jgi:hypothetical protein
MKQSTEHLLGGFEQRLLRELRQVVADNRQAALSVPETPARPAVFGRGLRIALAATAAAAAAAAIVSGLSIGGGSDGKAWAVDRNPDGSVTVRIDSLSDAAGLERKLNEAGVPALVQYLPPGKMCAGEEPARPPGAVTQTNGDPSAPSTGSEAGFKRGLGDSAGPVTETAGKPPAGKNPSEVEQGKKSIGPSMITVSNFPDGAVEFTVGTHLPAGGTLVVRNIAPQGAAGADMQVTFVQGVAQPCKVVDSSPAQ